MQRLGYQAAGGMDVVYSRDAQAPLLLLVEHILDEIRQGRFCPDETRSGRLVKDNAGAADRLAEKGQESKRVARWRLLVVSLGRPLGYLIFSLMSLIGDHIY